ncbi:MAG: glycosyltransferase family 25 protein [Hyphomonadaceae bacterium]
MQTPVIVINLERSADRRAQADAAYRAIGINPVFHKATDGRAADLTQHPAYGRAARVAAYGEDMRSTEIACFLSHVSALKHCLEAGYERAVIAEDDVHPTENFAPALAALERAPASFEFVRLIGTRPRRSLPVAPLTSEVEIVWPTHGMAGAQGYFVTRPAMEKIVRAGDTIVLPFDMMLDRYWRLGLTIFALKPFVVRDAEAASDIGVRPDAWTHRPRPWLRAKLRARKIGERVARSIANMDRRARLPRWRAELMESAS